MYVDHVCVVCGKLILRKDRCVMVSFRSPTQTGNRAMYKYMRFCETCGRKMIDICGVTPQALRAMRVEPCWWDEHTYEVV